MTASLSIGEYSHATYLSVKTLRRYGTPARGGHFAACEAPAEFVAEVRAGIHALTQVSIRA